MSGGEGACMAHSIPAKPIMVVDDDRAILDMVSELLDYEGYPVIAVSESRDAVTWASDEQPALILLDMMMPEMSGWQVLAALRANPTTLHIPVVLLSARHDLSALAENLKVETFLEKPFEIDDLLDVVRVRLAA